jgi:hypothetical protein
MSRCSLVYVKNNACTVEIKIKWIKRKTDDARKHIPWRYVWKLNQTVLELDFRAVKFFFSFDGIWTHTIVTLQHHSLSLTSCALDHSTTSTYIRVPDKSDCMKRLLGSSIIIVVLLIFFNKIDGNHKDTDICQKYW